MAAFSISQNKAECVIRVLEREDFLRLEAPLTGNRPVEMITADRHILQRDWNDKP